MGVEVFVHHFTTHGLLDASTQSFTGFGFTPQVVLFAFPSGSDETFTADHWQVLGMDDDTRNYVTGWFSDDGASPSSLGQDHLNSRSYSAFGKSWTVSSFDVDGLTITYNAKAGGNWTVMLIAFGNLNNAYVGDFTFDTTGTAQSITDPGFEGNAIVFMSTGMASFGIDSASLPFMVGMATGNSNQGVSVGASNQAAAPSAAGRWQLNDHVIVGVLSTLFHRGSFTSFDANGFTIGKTGIAGGGWVVSYMVLEADDASSVHMGNETQKTSTGTKDTTAPGFEAQGAIFTSCNQAASAGIQSHHRMSLGFGAANAEGCEWAGDTTAVDPISADRYKATDKALVLVDTDGPSAVDAEADYATQANGFTLDWTTADGTAREFLYLAFKKHVATAFVPRITMF